MALAGGDDVEVGVDTLKDAFIVIGRSHRLLRDLVHGIFKLRERTNLSTGQVRRGARSVAEHLRKGRDSKFWSSIIAPPKKRAPLRNFKDCTGGL